MNNKLRANIRANCAQDVNAFGRELVLTVSGSFDSYELTEYVNSAFNMAYPDLSFIQEHYFYEGNKKLFLSKDLDPMDKFVFDILHSVTNNLSKDNPECKSIPKDCTSELKKLQTEKQELRSRLEKICNFLVPSTDDVAIETYLNMLENRSQ